MTTSLRWGHLVLGLFAFQVGCCSIHVDYDGHFRTGMPLSIESDGVQDVCVDEGACKINGLTHVGRSLHSLHGHATRHLQCGSGCGEVYWDEYINEPPVCDPCGCDNQWVGGVHACKPWYSRLRDLWGYRYPGSSCSDCADCGHGGSVVWDSEGSGVPSGMGEEVISIRESPANGSPALKSQGMPTPAAPKSEPRLLPGDRESIPSSVLERGSVSGRIAPINTMPQERTTRVAVETLKKVPATPTSGRRKLTTQTR